MRAHLRQVAGVVAVTFRNPELRRVQIAFSAFNAAEVAVWIAMLVYAYNRGGAKMAGAVAIIQLVPAIIFAPFASALGDRYRPARVLALGYVAQGAGMAATAAVLLFEGPAPLAYAFATIATAPITMTRPTMAVLTPSLCRTPQELTASNVVSGWNVSISMLVAPAVAGVLLAVSGPGSVFLVSAVAVLLGAVLVAAIKGPAANPPSGSTVTAELAEGFSAIVREPAARTLVSLLGVQAVAIGMLDVLLVVLAVGTLGLGDGGVGYLNAAFGAGGALGIAVTASLVGRARLMPAVVVSVAAWGVTFGVMAVWSTAAAAVVLLVLAGGARTLLDVAGHTLLQRTAPADVLARVFGVLEGLVMAGLALGALLAPVLVSLAGSSGAILGMAVMLPLFAVALGKRLLQLDASAHVPVVEIGLLRSLPLFAMLPPPAIEGIARGLEAVFAAPGTVIVKEGEIGDRYYAIAEGELEVTINGRVVNVLRRGDGFGEIALLHDVPRTATVSARTPVKLYALAQEPFLEVLTGHPATRTAADAIAAGRLATT